MARLAQKSFKILQSKVPEINYNVPKFISAHKAARSKVIEMGKQYDLSKTSNEELETEQINGLVQQYAMKPETALPFSTLLEIGENPTSANLMMCAQLLHQELPIRFAQRIVMLENIPWDLGKYKEIDGVKQWYAKILKEISEIPQPNLQSDLHKFNCLLASINMDFLSMPMAVARAMLKWRHHNQICRQKNLEIDHALDRIFMRRLASTFLIDHYISALTPRPGFSGAIQKDCCPFEVAEYSAKNVKMLLHHTLGACPEIVVIGAREQTFPYVPSHLFFIVTELLKNSCRAVVEAHNGALGKLPPIKVVLSRGNEDMVIKVEDEGRGIKRSDLDFIWSYNFSTAAAPIEALDSDAENVTLGSLGCERSSLFGMLGYGMGLPNSRLHARYFGGDLHLESMEGYGTVAYAHIPFLGTQQENLDSYFFQSSVLESRNGYYFGTKDGKSAEDVFELSSIDYTIATESENQNEIHYFSLLRSW